LPVPAERQRRISSDIGKGINGMKPVKRTLSGRPALQGRGFIQATWGRCKVHPVRQIKVLRADTAATQAIRDRPAGRAAANLSVTAVTVSASGIKQHPVKGLFDFLGSEYHR